MNTDLKTFLDSDLLEKYLIGDISLEELYKVEFRYTLSRYLPDFSPIWSRNLLESFSITQVIYISLLSIGIKNVMNWNYKKSVLMVLKIYGVGFLIWHSFAVIMDLNFHQ